MPLLRISAFLLLGFPKLFQEEFRVFRQIRAFCLESAADEENGIRAVGSVHIPEELPAHAAGGNGENGVQVTHVFFRAFTDFLAYIPGEGEPSSEAGEDNRIRTGQAGELSVVAEGGNAGDRSV